MDGRKIPIGHSTRLGNNVPNKIQYLEGLRGIVATQVVLLHFVTAFLPDTAEHAAPPMRLLFDGHTAVYVFLISGAVLTPSFARDGAWIGQAAKRVVRIGIPVVLGALLNPMAQRLLSCGPSRQLGRLSFSIYLLHFPILFTLICVGSGRRDGHLRGIHGDDVACRGRVGALGGSPRHPARPPLGIAVMAPAIAPV
jgi:peptidoglycan/LPS O-acetylase OafA/YrhL